MKRFWDRHPLTTSVVGSLLATSVLAVVPAIRHFYAIVLQWFGHFFSLPVTVPVWQLLVFLVSPLVAVEMYRLVQRLRRPSEATFGPQPQVQASSPALPASHPITDERDQRVVLLTWSRQNTDALYGVIRFADLDGTLNLASGASKRHLRSVAASLEYYPLEEGPESITFKYRPHSEHSSGRMRWF